MTGNSIIEKIKMRWGVEKNSQFFIICLVFSITGSISFEIANPVLELVGVTTKTSNWIYWPVRIVVVFPIYQTLLVLFGTLFGQFHFFWKLEKKMLRRFIPKKKKAEDLEFKNQAS